MEIERRKYLQELIDRKHNGLIKVVTGARRAGKSYLLFRIFVKHLKDSGVNEDHIIRISLDERKMEAYRSPDLLLEHLESQIQDEQMHYLLLDEIQMADDFESVLNSLNHRENVDVYVTGSNSRLLSKDVITEFRGRGDEIHLYPLSFREFMSAYEGDRYRGWEEYRLYGGLPFILSRKTGQQKTEYLTNLFRETYLKDIIERHGIRNDAELFRLVEVLSSSVGSLTNPKRIADTFRTVTGSSVSQNTIKSYIDALEDAFLIKGAERYDVKGRRYIGSPRKYYFEDIGIRNALLNFRQTEENHVMENIIFNELRIRGYQVDVGVVETYEKDAEGAYRRKHLEIDFVAGQGSKRYYIQSAFALPDDEKIRQEVRPLLSVHDSFKKIVVTRDYVFLRRDNDGIVTMGILDFLLNENSLEL